MFILRCCNVSGDAGPPQDRFQFLRFIMDTQGRCWQVFDSDKQTLE